MIYTLQNKKQLTFYALEVSPARTVRRKYLLLSWHAPDLLLCNFNNCRVFIPWANIKSVICSRIEGSLLKPFGGTGLFVHIKLLPPFRSLNLYNAIKAFHILPDTSCRTVGTNPICESDPSDCEFRYFKVKPGYYIMTYVCMNCHRPAAVLRFLLEGHIPLRTQKIM
jgi:hypothetical protein